MGIFVKSARRCAHLHQVMAPRLVSPRSLFSHAGCSVSHVCAWRRWCGRGGTGAAAEPPRSPVGAFTLYCCEEEDEEQRERGNRKEEGVCVQQEVQVRHVINLRVPFPAPLPFLRCLFPSCHFSDFSLLPPLASELCPPSIPPLSPLTCRLLFCSFLPLHLSHIPMVHLGCGCPLQSASCYYPGGSFRLQLSMTTIKTARKRHNNINAKNIFIFIFIFILS